MRGCDEERVRRDYVILCNIMYYDDKYELWIWVKDNIDMGKGGNLV